MTLKKRIVCRAASAGLGIAIFYSPQAEAVVPAFSGATGPGAVATGGRGGDVYHVTNLNSDLTGVIPGSFLYGARNAPAAGRTIVFDVGGTIYQPGGTTNDDTMRFNWGNITVAGQTAPGPGITIAGTGSKWTGTNVILRNIAVRPNKSAQPATVTYDSFSLQVKNSIVDHVSATWFTDEGISETDAGANSTVQYAIIADGLNYNGHAFGSIISTQNPTTEYSYNHNLYGQLTTRIPAVGSEYINGMNPIATTEWSNNVINNWGQTKAGYGSGDNTTGDLTLRQFSKDNFVGNYYINNKSPHPTTNLFRANADHQLYASGNWYGEASANGTITGANQITNNNSYFGGGTTFVASPFAIAGTSADTRDSATLALQRVRDYSGMNWFNRNEIDLAIIAKIGDSDFNAINDLTGATQAAQWANLMAQRPDAGGNAPFTRAAGYDSDNDGMPNTWETKYGLNPNVADNNGDFDNDGYTNLEEYINEVAEWPAPGAIYFNGATSTRFAVISNWHLNAASAASAPDVWQPSKYDTAVINSGSMAVDAVGQHAGTLKLGNLSGSTGTMNVTAGWLEINTEVIVGATSGATGVLNLSGGQLVTPKFTKNSNGTFNFTGGTLTLIGTGSNFGGPLTVPAAGTLYLAASGAYPSAVNLTNNGQANITASQTLGQLAGTGSTAIAGSGVTVTAKHVRQGTLSITSGAKVSINADGTAVATSTLNSLSITTGGQLDLKNNDLIVRTVGGKNAIRALVESGRNGYDANGASNWNGPGIVSSTARTANTALVVDVYTIGVIRNGDLNDLNGGPGYAYTTWGGQSVGVEDILVKYTYSGDANLDGTITIDDYNAIDGTVLGLTGNHGWVSGDFDFSGAITIDDYNAIDTGFLYQGGQLSQAMLTQRLAQFGPAYVAHLETVAAAFASVPEPTTAGMLAIGAMGLLSRRRRKA